VKALSGFLQTLRARTPHPVLRTDFLIGFPTETPEEFEEALAFILEHFDEVACYGFEFHTNTKVAEMNLPPVAPEVITQRVAHALDTIRRNPRIVWHQGGQEPHTMLDREQHKDQLHRI